MHDLSRAYCSSRQPRSLETLATVEIERSANHYDLAASTRLKAKHPRLASFREEGEHSAGLPNGLRIFLRII